MDRYEYMNMPIGIFPQHVIEKYHLTEKVYKGCIWIEICRSIYGLPQAGKLANEFLRKKLARMGILKWSTRQAFGNTSPAPFNSHLWLTNLASNTREERTQSIC